MNPKLKERIAKIYELVKRGATEGEKQAAQNALDRILSKYNLEGIDLENLNREPYVFKYTSDLEMFLLSRIMKIIMSDKSLTENSYRRSINEYGRRCKDIVVWLTYVDYITMYTYYQYFRSHMKVQWEKVSTAELAKCRTTKTKNRRRKELQLVFFNRYVVASNLYDESEIKDRKKLTSKQSEDYAKMVSVEGGEFKKPLTGGLLIEENN